MRLYSTQKQAPEVSFREAVLRGLAPDGGLYMPSVWPELSSQEWDEVMPQPPSDIAATLFEKMAGDEFDRDTLNRVFREALNFPMPLVRLDEQTWVLELFHGPTLAFKDVGARTMARIMPLSLPPDEKRDICILTATSGDTGAAVAHGFYGVPRTRVFVLYPSGKVSGMQEKQFTTLGGNITAIEVNGTFDDCQRLVKAALREPALQEAFVLTSANSINIARLLPQLVYYVNGMGQWVTSHDSRSDEEWPVFVVPSGNFGNVCAGLFAARMGLPNGGFTISSNRNDVVPAFLRGGPYRPRPSVSTVSNAMDVGDPSNFSRIVELCGGLDEVRERLAGWSVTDEETAASIRETLEKRGYLADPHTATGLAALEQLRKEGRIRGNAIVLATAHPGKFLGFMDRIVPGKTRIPESLAVLQAKDKHTFRIETDFEALLSFLNR